MTDDELTRLRSMIYQAVDQLMEHFESCLILCSRGNKHTVVEAGNVFACRKLGEMYCNGEMEPEGETPETA